MENLHNNNPLYQDLFKQNPQEPIPSSTNTSKLSSDGQKSRKVSVNVNNLSLAAKQGLQNVWGQFKNSVEDTFQKSAEWKTRFQKNLKKFQRLAKSNNSIKVTAQKSTSVANTRITTPQDKIKSGEAHPQPEIFKAKRSSITSRLSGHFSKISEQAKEIKGIVRERFQQSKTPSETTPSAEQQLTPNTEKHVATPTQVPRQQKRETLSGINKALEKVDEEIHNLGSAIDDCLTSVFSSSRRESTDDLRARLEEILSRNKAVKWTLSEMAEKIRANFKDNTTNSKLLSKLEALKINLQNMQELQLNLLISKLNSMEA